MTVPTLPLDRMTAEEKVGTMESLWESLSATPEEVESPTWHEEELRERERKIASGETKFITWEHAKSDIHSRTS
jgi:hypothetical protein